MHEKGWRSGAGQGGGNFIANVAGFSHAGHNHAAPAVHDHFAGPRELVVDSAFEGINGVALNADGADGRRSEIAGSLFGHRALGLAVGTLQMLSRVYHFHPATMPGYRKFSQTDHCYQYILGTLD